MCDDHPEQMVGLYWVNEFWKHIIFSGDAFPENEIEFHEKWYIFRLIYSIFMIIRTHVCLPSNRLRFSESTSAI